MTTTAHARALQPAEPASHEWEGDAPPLTLPQLRALTCKAQTPDVSQRQAAVFAGVSEASLRRWLATPSFARLWSNHQERGEAIRRAQRSRLYDLSLQTLIEVQEDAGVVASTRVDAAARALQHLQREREHSDTPARSGLLAMLESWSRQGREHRQQLEEEEAAEYRKQRQSNDGTSAIVLLEGPQESL
jgi:hypothetical protein